MPRESYSLSELQGFIDNLENKKVLVFGDIMLDRYLHGDTTRISPEAPVPVVQIEAHRLLMGGCGNVARNIKYLGGKVSLVSVCGDDNAGNILNGICRQEAIDAYIHSVPGRKTTTKNRIIARHQQVLRYDEEDLMSLPGDVEDEIFAQLEELIAEHDVMILSDYGKGLINEGFVQSLQAAVQRSNPDIKIIVDPKTPNYPLYKGAYLLTPNTKEAAEATGMPTGSVLEIRAAGRYLMQTLGLKHLLTTLGAQGMALFMSPEDICHIPTTAKEVFDVTGAGDTVIGVIGLCLAAGTPLLASCIIANYAAGLVVGEVGAASVTRDELSAAVREYQDNLVSSW